MAVRIVQDVPGAGGLRRILRGMAVLLGLVLVLIGLVAAIVPVLYLLLALSSLVDDSSDLPTVSAGDAPVFLAVSATAVIAPLAGLRLIRGRRRLGLFLRKFGLAEATRTVTYALATAVGRSVRLVTLDDAMVAPLGVARGRRRFFSLTTLVALVVTGYGLYWFLGGGFDDFVSRSADDAASQVQADDPLQQIFGTMFAAAIGAALAVVVAVILVLVPVSLAIGTTLLSGSSWLAARRSERAATQTIDGAHAIAATARSVARRARRILGPRLVVVRVPTAVWQQAVRGLAAVADVVVMDVSQPTENLLWEVSAVKAALPGNWVLVGAGDRVARLAQPFALAPGSAEHRLAEALDGEEILSYGPDRSGRRRFARALRRRLDQIAARG